MCNISSCYNCHTVWLLIFITCMVNDWGSYTFVQSIYLHGIQEFEVLLPPPEGIVRNTRLGTNTIPKNPCFSALKLN